jgi:hypothetical protein
MLFGHNSNVKVGDATFHVQTEDRGVAHALIDTTVYSAGRVLHRRTHNYLDLLPLNPETEKALKARVDQQHRTVIQEMMTGALNLLPTAASQPRVAGNLPPGGVLPAPAQAPKHLVLELVNAKSWLVGKRVSLQVAVKDEESGLAVAKATVTAAIAGTVQGPQVQGETGTDGRVVLEFDLPRLGSGDAELVIDASAGEAKTQLRFQLKAKIRAVQTS